MGVRYILVVGVCFLISFTNVQGLQTVNGRIKITVGTTSSCSDTVRFIANLVEVYNLYKDFLDIEFIPWGRTVRNGDGSLTCQGEANDCWANRVHRCALYMLQGNLETQMHYMNCEFTAPFPAFMQGSYNCAHTIGLNLINIDHCVHNPNDDLDLEAERRGTVLTRAINFIPSIVFNDDIDLNLHTQSLSGLKSMICFALAADASTGVIDCNFKS